MIEGGEGGKGDRFIWFFATLKASMEEESICPGWGVLFYRENGGRFI
jgi:hypothetical protein